MKITKLEADLIDRIVHNEYQPLNGGEPDSFVDLSDIWANCLLESKSDGGVLTSLQKKGLAGFSANGGKVGSLKNDDTVWLTEAGYNVYLKQVKK